MLGDFVLLKNRVYLGSLIASLTLVIEDNGNDISPSV